MVKLTFLILISLFYTFSTITQCAPVNPQSPNIITDVNKRTSPITSFVPLFITQAKRSSPDTIPISKKSAMPIEIPVIMKRTLPLSGATSAVSPFNSFSQANNGINGFGLLPLTGGFGAFPFTPVTNGFLGAPVAAI
ncbi:1258_t:CDS:1 [Gigaspora margarita]|uniref:1258_t:CDS:1 n=1 Tax=Gigaspora margarita TaxID=4874 RepID=A0ABN7UVV0_GIGMA|nr:1258_t:CDS:1 [Gigaspora margarita]